MMRKNTKVEDEQGAVMAHDQEIVMISYHGRLIEEHKPRSNSYIMFKSL